MRSLKLFYCLIIFSILLPSCKKEKAKNDYDYQVIAKCNKELTDIIVQDIFSPPVASRIYAYANIAGYEALVPGYEKFRSLSGQLNGLDSIPTAPGNKEIDFTVASVQAFWIVATKLVYTENMAKTSLKNMLDSLQKSGVSEEIIHNSVEYGNAVAKKIIEWSGNDQFKETRKMTRYTCSDSAGCWQLTPPDYMAVLEPYWGTMRPFAMKSGSEFKIANPPVFDCKPGATFYDNMKEVFNVSKNLTPEQKKIAEYWDCNPNISHHHGHLTYFTQKLTPGGHWISIASTAIKTKKATAIEAAETYALMSMGLADGFIGCWSEKFRTNYIRPVTCIKKEIDIEWEPLLQTPPFPEYPSGHSVVSASAATVLTGLYGDGFAFTDSAELDFGFGTRPFKSFMEAANEAAISRVYGGIHFRPAMEEGLKLGNQIGQNILTKVKTRK